MSENLPRRSSRVDPDRLAALEDERDFLLRSLVDLDSERAVGDLEEDDYLELKDDYTRRAADVLRSIESEEATLAELPTRGWRRTLAWIVGLAVLGGLAGYAIGQSSGERGSDGTFTGGARQSVAARLSEAEALLADPERWDDAVEIYSDVIDEQPGNVEALTYRAWLLYRSGDDPETLLDDWAEASQIEPEYQPAIVFHAIALDDLGRHGEAAQVLETLPLEGLDPSIGALVDSSGLVGRVFGEAIYDQLSASNRPDLDDLGIGPDVALRAAGHLLGTDKPERVLGAIKLYDAVLADRPEHPAALSRKALLLAQASTGDPGLLDVALDLVDRAVAANPDDLEALVSRATLYAAVDPVVACTDISRVESVSGGSEVGEGSGLVEQAERLAETLDC